MPLFWLRTPSLVTAFPVWVVEFPLVDEPLCWQPANAAMSITMLSQSRPRASAGNFRLFICRPPSGFARQSR